MKVLYLVTKSERGGAQIHVLDLVRSLHDRMDVVVACGDDGFLLDECRKLGVEVHVVPELVHPISPVQDARAVYAVTALIRRCRPNLIHGHTAKAGVVARLAGFFTRIPSIYTVHCWSFIGRGYAASLVATWVERAMRLAGGTVVEVCLSNFAMARRRGVVSPGRHLAIWNGMPDTSGRSIPDAQRAVRIVMAARFVEQKHHAHLLEALAGIQEPWHLTLAGGGPTKAQMEKRSVELGIQDRVTFTGDINQVELLLANSDLFVLPSKYESLPLSIIEAMRAGLPVIATSVGGVSELVKDGVTGRLVSPDDITDLRKALRELINSPETRARMGHMGRLRYQDDFTLETMVGSVVTLYRELCGTPTGCQELLPTTGLAI